MQGGPGKQRRSAVPKQGSFKDEPDPCDGPSLPGQPEARRPPRPWHGPPNTKLHRTLRMQSTPVELMAQGGAVNGVLVAILGYVLAQFAVGVVVSRRMASEADYILAGRRLGVGLIAFSVFATY